MHINLEKRNALVSRKECQSVTRANKVFEQPKVNSNWCERQHARAWGGCDQYFNGCDCLDCKVAAVHQYQSLGLRN